MSYAHVGVFKFSLLAGLWKYLFTRPTLHVLIIGLDHAGKTVRKPFQNNAIISRFSATDVAGTNKNSV